MRNKTISQGLGNDFSFPMSTFITGCMKKPANTIICIILLLSSISMSVLLILLLGFENTF